MEALRFIKLWRHGGNCDGVQVSNVVVGSDSDQVDEGDDSFFELELALSDFDKKKNDCNSQEQVHYTAKTSCNNGESRISLSSTDVFSKRKILPIEPTSTSKPRSPIAVLKSAPRLRVSIFKNSKSLSNSKPEKQENDKLFNTRACSFRRPNNAMDDSSSSSSSKRGFPDVIQKYLKLVQRLYVKVSKRKNVNMRFSGQLTEASPTSSPAILPVRSPKNERNTSGGFRVMNRHLGKSRSASSPARRDNSLIWQQDGIQSAILHCKKSFSSSRDSSSFSRATSSSSSQGTLSNVSSKDASLSPRFSNDSSW